MKKIIVIFDSDLGMARPAPPRLEEKRVGLFANYGLICPSMVSMYDSLRLMLMGLE